MANPEEYECLMIQSIGQIAITVSDLARAVQFYRETLGLPYLFEAGGMAFFQCATTRLMLTVAKEGSPANSIIYFKTDALEKQVEEMTSKNVHWESKPFLVAKMPDHELWMAFFRDTENNLHGLMEERRA
jgi:methylmalonyl-CoA/ethylmalonyl-CoA epimerase